MNVTILDELWLTDDGDGQLSLGLPAVVNRLTGAGVPGLVVPRPVLVLKPGAVVTLAVPPACGCTTVMRYDSGAEVLQHQCGHGW